jgi:hypothetical protein
MIETDVKLYKLHEKNHQMGHGELRNQATVEISTTMIWCILADGGYHCWVARKVPYLTKMQK